MSFHTWLSIKNFKRFNFRLRRLQKFTKYEIVVQVNSSHDYHLPLLPLFSWSWSSTSLGQAVNGHGEGPLSDLVVGQTTESGEHLSNMKKKKPKEGTIAFKTQENKIFEYPQHLRALLSTWSVVPSPSLQFISSGELRGIMVSSRSYW